jgi:hypothetical protein
MTTGFIRRILRVIKPGMVRWAEQVARLGEVRNAHKILVGNPEERHHFQDLGVDGRLLLEWILRS